MHRSRVRQFGALAAVLVLGVGVLTACSDSDSDSGSGSNSDTTNATSDGPSDGVPTYTEDDTDITVALEHAFVIELPSTAGTGYEWTAVTNPKLQQMTTEQVPGGSQPGAQGTQRITFRSQGTGSTTLVLNYARSFEQGVPPAKTATFDVTITD
ncbi:MAG: protease inhibitor I42 family protein [Acidimicrobiia bacterium]